MVASPLRQVRRRHNKNLTLIDERGAGASQRGPKPCQDKSTPSCGLFLGASRGTNKRTLLFGRSLRTYQHSPRNVGLALTTFHVSNDSGDGPAVVAIDRKACRYGDRGLNCRRGKARDGVVAGATATKRNADGIGEDSAIQSLENSAVPTPVRHTMSVTQLSNEVHTPRCLALEDRLFLTPLSVAFCRGSFRGVVFPKSTRAKGLFLSHATMLRDDLLSDSASRGRVFCGLPGKFCGGSTGVPRLSRWRLRLPLAGRSGARALRERSSGPCRRLGS